MESKKKKGKKAMNDQALKVRTVVIPDHLWDALRIESIREKRSASEIIRQLVNDYLTKGGKRK